MVLTLGIKTWQVLLNVIGGILTLGIKTWQVLLNVIGGCVPCDNGLYVCYMGFAKSMKPTCLLFIMWERFEKSKLVMFFLCGKAHEPAHYWNWRTPLAPTKESLLSFSNAPVPRLYQPHKIPPKSQGVGVISILFSKRSKYIRKFLLSVVERWFQVYWTSLMKIT
jgi:hypothetical protein